MSTWAKESVILYVETQDQQRGETRDEFIARISEELEVSPYLVEEALGIVERYEEDA